MAKRPTAAPPALDFRWGYCDDPRWLERLNVFVRESREKQDRGENRPRIGASQLARGGYRGDGLCGLPPGKPPLVSLFFHVAPALSATSNRQEAVENQLVMKRSVFFGKRLQRGIYIRDKKCYIVPVNFRNRFGC
jgi:hypothetical protein